MEMFGEDFESFGQEEDGPMASSASKSTAVGKATKGQAASRVDIPVPDYGIHRSTTIGGQEVRRSTLLVGALPTNRHRKPLQVKPTEQ